MVQAGSHFSVLIFHNFSQLPYKFNSEIYDRVTLVYAKCSQNMNAKSTTHEPVSWLVEDFGRREGKECVFVIVRIFEFISKMFVWNGHFCTIFLRKGLGTKNITQLK